VQDLGLLTSSNDETAKLWSFDGEEIFTLAGHVSFIYSANVLNFGRYITASDDRTVRIW
jgi:phospholipase A-2-activating protein